MASYFKMEDSLRLSSLLKQIDKKGGEMKGKIHDLDDIFISPRIYETWILYCPQAMEDIMAEVKRQKKSITLEDIPDEQFREYPDGTGEIFISISMIGKEIKLAVPKGEWAFRK